MSETPRRNFLKVAGAAVVAAALGIIGYKVAKKPSPTPTPTTQPPSTTAAPTTAPPPKEKVLIFGLKEDIVTLDPAMHRKRVTESVIQQYAEPLFWRTNDMRVIPHLLESYEFVDDLTWRLKLRKGIKFHDGTELKAEDVKFTLERILDPNQNSPRASMIDEIDTITIIDDYTLEIKTKYPSGPLMVDLTYQEILPKHAVEAQGEDFFKNPFSTGPFKFVEWVPGERIVFEKNPDYWGGPAEVPPVGPPKVDKLIFKVIPDSATRMQALKAGEIHISYGFTADQAEEMAKDPNLVVEKVRAARSVFVFLNTHKAPFNDKRVRHALNMAVDVDAIIKNVLKGYGRRIACMSFPGVLGHDPNLEPFPYDPDRARQLLAEAGYPDGFDAVMMYDEEWRKDQAEAIAYYLGQVGVNVTIQLMDWGTIKNEYLLKAKGDMYFGSWGCGELELYGNVNSTFAREKDTYAFQYHNDEVTRLMKEALATLDPEQRAQKFMELERILQEDAPAIWLWEQFDPWVYRKEVTFTPRTDERYNLVDADISV